MTGTKVGGAESGRRTKNLRSVQYTIQVTEYHDSRVKKLDPLFDARAATSGPLARPFVSFPFFFYCFSYFLIGDDARVASSTRPCVPYAPKEATKIMRGIEQIPKDSRELRRDFDRAKIFDRSCVLKFQWATDLSIIHNLESLN